MPMAVTATLSLLMMALIPSAMASNTPTDQTLGVAIEEMQRANYFAFVMLLNMVPSNKIPSNITFLMPNNRVLAKAVIPENDVLDFLLRHSIPTPLRFEHLKHFPTGTIIPSSEPKFVLKVSNNGRKSFYLNNVKLISPDICVAGSSVRCHGIDGVLGTNETLPLPTDSPPLTMAPPPSLSPPGPPSPHGASGGSFDMAPAATPQPVGSGPGPQNSGSPRLASVGRLIVCLYCVLLLTINLS